jgi:hypothetical protein
VIIIIAIIVYSNKVDEGYEGTNAYETNKEMKDNKYPEEKVQ